MLSDTEAVQTQLKFKFNDPTNEKQNSNLTTQWVKFIQAHRELIDVPSGTDQQGLVDAFIECNLTRVSKAQYYMFAYLRDLQPKPTTLKKAYLLLLAKWRETEAACAIGVQVGMIFPTDPTKLHHQDSKIGGKEIPG